MALCVSEMTLGRRGSRHSTSLMLAVRQGYRTHVDRINVQNCASAANMKVNVLYFAVSREVVGKSQEELELADGCSTQKLLTRLVEAYPGLESVMKACVFAVNQEYVPPGQEMVLKDGDEVAIIPPLSGG